MQRKPSLLLISVAWSLLLAAIMTVIAFLHNFQGELTDPNTGGIRWRDVGFLFLFWFVFAEAVMIVGGLIYIAGRRLSRRRPD
jgi:hypothetical protein